MLAAIGGIAYYLPEQRLTSEQLAHEYPDWSIDKIVAKTGIEERRIAASNECSSDLAVCAAQQLFREGACRPESIDFVLFCTQSPDYYLPTTACLLQHRLNIPVTAGALDFNLGCSGFVYGLGLAKGLVESGQARNVLLLTAETYSRFIDPADRSVRTIFGDGAAATVIKAVDGGDAGSRIGPFIFGTDGSGADNLIVRAGGMRHPDANAAAPFVDDQGNSHSASRLYMNGAEIFKFTLDVVPKAVSELLRASGKAIADIDLFVFHQANLYMLEHLRKKIGIPREKFSVALKDCGNTVSSTIPIALRRAQDIGQLKTGDLVVIVGFGVGYSWSAALIRWGA